MSERIITTAGNTYTLRQYADGSVLVIDQYDNYSYDMKARVIETGLNKYTVYQYKDDRIFAVIDSNGDSVGHMQVEHPKNIKNKCTVLHDTNRNILAAIDQDGKLIKLIDDNFNIYFLFSKKICA